ncbi:MAG: HipA domain-containing protein [Leucobacter sp.]
MRHLDVYMDGELAAEILQTDTGKTTCSYSRDYQSAPGSTPISMSMPLERQQHPQRVVVPYLQGLLSDSEGRRGQLGREFGVNPSNPVALLEHVGADAAGAIQILPHGATSSDAASRTGDVTVLSHSDFAALIADLIKNRDTWGARTARGRWSLPGAQPKVALFRTQKGEWGIPNDSTPTTHILKPSVEPYSDHHFNEFMTMHAARVLGLNTATDDLLRTDAGDAVFVSQRYDRELRNGRWVRLHQEDTCQALSVDPARKYQSDGGPGIKALATLFKTFDREDRETASLQLFEALCFNLAMQGTDAHAKNYSIMHAGDRAWLAPLYDMASHAPYPTLSGEPLTLSMAVDGDYRVNAVGIRHLTKTAQYLGLDEQHAHDRAVEILHSTPDAYLEAAGVARDKFGADPFIDVLTDAVASYANIRGWH